MADPNTLEQFRDPYDAPDLRLIPVNQPADVIAKICAALTSGDLTSARSLLNHEYPFRPSPIVKRTYGPREATHVFIRDGFIDRYSGVRLLFPPVLRVVSAVLPREFPYHPNWKTDVTHQAYMALSATVDHLKAVTLGGADEYSNWVTTSMARNFAKQNTTLEELGWTLHAPGDFAQWDGMIQWFVNYAEAKPEILRNSTVRQWYNAGRAALAAAIRASR